MILRRLIAELAIAVLAVSALSACSSDQADGGGASVGSSGGTSSEAGARASETTPSESPAATIVPFDKWKNLRDGPSKIRFVLPSAPRTATDPAVLPDGTKVETRSYLGGSGAQQDGVGQEGVSLLITTGRSSPVRYDSTAIGVTGQTLVKRFRATGAKDVSLVEQRDGNVRGYTSRTYRLRFMQPAGGLKSDPVVWFVCEIAAGPAFVVVQTIQFPPRGQGAEVLARERQVQQHTIDSLRFP